MAADNMDVVGLAAVITAVAVVILAVLGVGLVVAVAVVGVVVMTGIGRSRQKLLTSIVTDFMVGSKIVVVDVMKIRLRTKRVGWFRGSLTWQ